jgi:hypothetical protein
MERYPAKYFSMFMVAWFHNSNGISHLHVMPVVAENPLISYLATSIRTLDVLRQRHTKNGCWQIVVILNF